MPSVLPGTYGGNEYTSPAEPPSFLLIGPYDPHCGEYTFLAPPLGVWRLAGVLTAAGFEAQVFDPNLTEGPPERALEAVLADRPWSVIGVSTTGMTLRFDLALAHQARRARPGAILVAGGMEATFRPDLLATLAPFDLLVLGEGEKPLLELGARLRAGAAFADIAGTACRGPDGQLHRRPRPVLDRSEMVDAIGATPYEVMPYPAYWERLEAAYRVGALPVKADREARLSEIRSVRLITSNYCPMGCTFCSSTNFLHEAQGSIAKIARLDEHEVLEMVHRIVVAQPGVRTIIFQDDIFVYRNDPRILPLCSGILDAKRAGTLPQDLQFISTNRIDAMTRERLAAMKAAGFRVLGFGIESFSHDVLVEFNKGRIEPYVEPMLNAAVELGITPFLDLILTSPRCRLDNLAETLRQAFRWLKAGCEMGMYPYVIPFSGAAMASDPTLIPHTESAVRRIAGTAVEWRQPVKILPLDGDVRWAILEIERRFARRLELLEERVAHLPSRVRSLLWLLCSAAVMSSLGQQTPAEDEVLTELLPRLPGLTPAERKTVAELLVEQPVATSKVTA